MRHKYNGDKQTADAQTSHISLCVNQKVLLRSHNLFLKFTNDHFDD